MLEAGTQLLAYERNQDEGSPELVVRVWWSATLWAAAVVSSWGQRLWTITHGPSAIRLLHPTSYVVFTILLVHVVFLATLLRSPKRLTGWAGWTAALISALTIGAIIWLGVFGAMRHLRVTALIEQTASLCIFLIMPMGTWIVWIVVTRPSLRRIAWLSPWRIAVLLAFANAAWLACAGWSRVLMDAFDGQTGWVQLVTIYWPWCVRQLGGVAEIFAAAFLGFVLLRSSQARPPGRWIAGAIVIVMLAELYRLTFRWIDYGRAIPAKELFQWSVEILEFVQGLVMLSAPMFAALTWPGSDAAERIRARTG
jgi:hypothetical protein